MIAEKPQYPGQCMLCKQTFNKAQLTRHVKKCVAQHANEAGKPVKMFHLAIEGSHLPMYWLHVEIPGALTLEYLDGFLRDIWLECCGHLSCFTIDGQRYSVHPAEDVFFGPPEKTMGQKLYNVLGPGAKFQHEYDYGSTFTKTQYRQIGPTASDTSSITPVIKSRKQDTSEVTPVMFPPPL